MGKHSQGELEQMQSLPLEVKIEMSKNRIRQWYEYWDGNVYVSRSGGKDSDVLGHLVATMYPDVPQVFCNTGLELPSVRIHAIDVCDTVIRPKLNFVQIITKYGYPVISKEISQAVGDAQIRRRKGLSEDILAFKKLRGERKNKDGSPSTFNPPPKYYQLVDAPFRISEKCCYHMKKSPFHKYEVQTDMKPWLGIMASESVLRKTNWKKYGCNAYDKNRTASYPLSFWTEQDILQYIIDNNIEIADVYGQIEKNLKDGSLFLTGEQRTGCAFCGYGIQYDKQRFVRLKQQSPKIYDYVIGGGKFDDLGLWIPNKGLGYSFVLDYLNDRFDFGIEY